MKNRLFVIGCSYTSYCWPAYGEYLGTGYKQVYNFGKAGAGNEYIFNTTCNVFDRYKPNENDTVIVQWSGVGRKDIIQYDSEIYTTVGNLDWQDLYPKKYVKKYFNIAQSASLLISYVLSVDAISKQSKCKFITFNMLDPWFDLFYGEPFNTNVFDEQYRYIADLYPFDRLKETFKKVNALRSLEDFCWEYALDTPLYILADGKLQQDTHPSTHQHYLYAKYINKEHNLGIEELEKQSVKDYVKVYDDFFIDENMFQNPDLGFKKINKELKGYFLTDRTNQFAFSSNQKFIKSKLGYIYYSNEFQLHDRWLGL